MRFPLAALFFVVASFIFFAIFAVMTLTINEVKDVLDPLASELTEKSTFLSELNNIQLAFGVIGILFFIMGILLIFILDALADEPEYFYRER